MTATKRLVSFFMAVLMTFSLLAVSASAATPRNGFNVSYRMDGENVVETIVFSDATMIRTVAPTGTMTIKTIESGSTSTARVKADYSVYKKICEAQYGIARFLSTPSARRATAKTETKSLFSNKLYNILHEFRRALIYNGSKSYPNHAK